MPRTQIEIIFDGSQYDGVKPFAPLSTLKSFQFLASYKVRSLQLSPVFTPKVFAIVGVFANSVEDGTVLHYCLPSNLGCIATRITMYHHNIEQLGGK